MQRMRVTALVAVALLVAQGCAQPPAPPGRPGSAYEYRVAPPDVLSIIVRPEPAILRTVTIRPDGRISLDLVGDLYVEGMTVPEIQQAIETEVVKYIVHPDVTVLLDSSESRQFYIWGEVGRPGGYALIGDVTIAEAIARAGGPRRFAKLSSTRLVRPTGPIMSTAGAC